MTTILSFKPADGSWREIAEIADITFSPSHDVFYQRKPKVRLPRKTKKALMKWQRGSTARLMHGDMHRLRQLARFWGGWEMVGGRP